jgi:hypothetical protein
MSIFYPSSLYFIIFDFFALNEYYKTRAFGQLRIPKSARTCRRTIFFSSSSKIVCHSPRYWQGRLCKSQPTRAKDHNREGIEAKKMEFNIRQNRINKKQIKSVLQLVEVGRHSLVAAAISTSRDDAL